ncbi:uncharacterized protein LOC128556039 [Mercenaria mercenaria]|uniref:uncharacterized protein LOC128556039 n=1 Tax=Mercenaria mercenaria TaxID=6596 RepID=UPI00234F6537|nr:uncharacterized protein LOC128556039 [Mercenaria mercenaria]
MAERYDLRVKILEKTVIELQQTTIAHKRQIKELKTDNRVKTNIISELEKRIENLETKADTLRSDNETNDIEDSEKDITKHQLMDEHRLKNTMPKQGRIKRGFQSHMRRTNVETRVAFFASMSSHSPHLGINQDIVFDHAITNIGNAYNERHGTFIAPVAGTYVFSVTLTHYKSGSLSGDANGKVVVNGITIALLYMTEQQSSQMIIVDLKGGDDVSVENRDLDDGYMVRPTAHSVGFCCMKMKMLVQLLVR